MFAFKMFYFFIFYCMAERMSLGVHIYTSMYFPRKLFLSPVMNPDGGEPVSIPRAPPILLLAFWL